MFEKKLSREKGEKSNFCASRTTLCRQKIKIWMQIFFLENVSLSTKFDSRLEKKQKKSKSIFLILCFKNQTKGIKFYSTSNKNKRSFRKWVARKWYST